MRPLEQTYDLDAIRRRASAAGAPFVVGFSPWPDDMPGLTRSVRERHVEAEARPLSRTVWDRPEARDVRVLVDVAEAASAADAIESLIGRLESNQIARLPEGPPDLGSASFVHPAGAPPAVFFARGNLCVAVVSFGSRPTDVLPTAVRLDRRAAERPQGGGGRASIALERSRARAGEAIGIALTLSWTLGDEAYVKYFAAGGEILRRDGRLYVTAARGGEAAIEAFVVERGRDTSMARAVLTVE